MSRSVRRRLAAMMFGQYFVMGLWAVTLAAFLMGAPDEGGLSLSARHVGLIYGTLAIGATAAPLFVGLLADRLFATQRVLAALHLLGASLLGAAWLWSAACATDIRARFNQLASDEWFDDHHNVYNQLGRAEELQDFLTDPEPVRYAERQYRRSAQEWADISAPSPWRRLTGKVRRLLSPAGPVIGSYPPPGTPEDCQSELASIRERLQPALQRLRSHPEVVAASERAFPPLFALMLAYCCCYLPTITLTNAITFRNLPDPARHYGPIRSLGTVGWVAAGLFVGFAAPAVSPLPFLYAAAASAVLAVFCLTLPHTPPAGQPKTLGDALGLPALRMLADRPFLVYVLTSLAATSLMPFHNSFTNKFLVDLHVAHPAAVQTLAQPTEILGAVLIPHLWVRWGTKRMLLLGLLASAGRFALYASRSVPGILALGLPLHGVGFSLFYIAAAQFVDRQAPPDLRASAQGLVTLITLGAGGILGNWFAGRVVEFHTAGGAVDWTPVWLVPALGTFAAAALFGVLFREQKLAADERR